MVRHYIIHHYIISAPENVYPQPRVSLGGGARDSGATPLLAAAQEGHFAAVQALVGAKAQARTESAAGEQLGPSDLHEPWRYHTMFYHVLLFTSARHALDLLRE